MCPSRAQSAVRRSRAALRPCDTCEPPPPLNLSPIFNSSFFLMSQIELMVVLLPFGPMVVTEPNQFMYSLLALPFLAGLYEAQQQGCAGGTAIGGRDDWVHDLQLFAHALAHWAWAIHIQSATRCTAMQYIFLRDGLIACVACHQTRTPIVGCAPSRCDAAQRGTRHAAAAALAQAARDALRRMRRQARSRCRDRRLAPATSSTAATSPWSS